MTETVGRGIIQPGHMKASMSADKEILDKYFPVEWQKKVIERNGKLDFQDIVEKVKSKPSIKRDLPTGAPDDYDDVLDFFKSLDDPDSHFARRFTPQTEGPPKVVRPRKPEDEPIKNLKPLKPGEMPLPDGRFISKLKPETREALKDAVRKAVDGGFKDKLRAEDLVNVWRGGRRLVVPQGFSADRQIMQLINLTK